MKVDEWEAIVARLWSWHVVAATVSLVSTYVVCKRLSLMQRLPESGKAKFVLKFLRTLCSEICFSFFCAAHEFFTYLRSSAAVFCQALLLCAAAFSYAAHSEYAGVTSSNPTWGWAFCPQEQWHEFENHLTQPSAFCKSSDKRPAYCQRVKLV